MANFAPITSETVVSSLTSIRDSLLDVQSNDGQTNRILAHSQTRDTKLVCYNASANNSLSYSKNDSTIETSSMPIEEYENAVDVLKQHKISFNQKDNQLVIQSGNYHLSSHLLLTTSKSILIEKGSKFELDSGINVLIRADVKIDGSENAPVIIKPYSEKGPFGCFAIVGKNEKIDVEINNLKVSGGSFGSICGLEFTGQFAVYGANTTIRNSTFIESNGDDGLNVKYSKAVLENCRFENNMADQVDLDFCVAKVSNCTFSPSSIDPNGDGLDFSGSFGFISNCTYTAFKDKALSVGEKSKVLISNCDINSNYNGVAVKDQSKTFLHQNKLSGNHRDIICYIKKPIFDIPSVFVTSSLDPLRIALVSGKAEEIDQANFESVIETFEKEFKTFQPSLRLSSKVELANLIEQ